MGGFRHVNRIIGEFVNVSTKARQDIDTAKALVVPSRGPSIRAVAKHPRLMPYRRLMFTVERCAPSPAWRS